MKETILVVDANDSYSQQLQPILVSQLAYNVHIVKNVQAALSYLAAGQPKVDMVLVSVADPQAAISATQSIKGFSVSLPVAVISEGGEQRVAQLLDAGAYDVLGTNASLQRIRASLANILTMQRMRQYISHLEQQCANNGIIPNDGVQDPISPLLLDSNGHMKKLKMVEKEIIQFALNYCGGCMTHAAKNLGIGRSTLYRRVQALKLGSYISRENQTTRPMMRMSSSVRS